MNIFLAIVRKDGQSPPEALMQAVRFGVPGLPFESRTAHLQTWQSPTGAVSLIVWSNETDRLASSSLIFETHDGAKTMAGHVIAQGVSNPWDVKDVCQSVSFSDQSVSRLGGTWALVKANSDPPSLHIFNTITRWMPVYWAENSESIAVSNRALVAHLLVRTGRGPAFDPIAIGTFLPLGRYENDATPWLGVNVMPGNSRLLVTSKGVRVRRFDDFQTEISTQSPSASVYADLEERLLASVRPVSGMPVTVGLSGGRDSRLVAAALQRAGVQFAAETHGFPESPEVVLAQTTAELLGVPHTFDLGGEFCAETQHFEVDPLRRARCNAMAFDGMVFGWESLPAERSFRRSVRLGGEGSSALLLGFARKTREMRSVSWQQAERLLLDQFRSVSALLNEDVLLAQRLFVQHWLDETAIRRPRAALQYAEVDLRNGRWVGPMVVGRSASLHVQPLMDEQFVRAALKIKVSSKMTTFVFWQLMRNLNPALADLPMVNKHWVFEREAPLAGFEAGWQERRPLVATPDTRGTFDWRSHWTFEMYGLFFETIMRNSKNDDLFLAVKRDSLERWFADCRGQHPSPAATKLAWSLLTSTVLLDCSFREEAPNRTISITPPPPGGGVSRPDHREQVAAL